MTCVNQGFLVICAGYRSIAEALRAGIIFPKYVQSSFSVKMVLNCVHIWSVNLFLVKDKAPGRKLIKMTSL